MSLIDYSDGLDSIEMDILDDMEKDDYADAAYAAGLDPDDYEDAEDLLRAINGIEDECEYSDSDSDSAEEVDAEVDTPMHSGVRYYTSPSYGRDDFPKDCTQNEGKALAAAFKRLEEYYFSKKALMEMLMKRDGFKKTDAAFAVENCKADWKEEAFGQAGYYIEKHSWSPKTVAKHLELRGYEKEEIDYAMKQYEGIDEVWNEHALVSVRKEFHNAAVPLEGIENYLRGEGFEHNNIAYALESIERTCRGEKLIKEQMDIIARCDETIDSIDPKYYHEPLGPMYISTAIIIFLTYASFRYILIEIVEESPDYFHLVLGFIFFILGVPFSIFCIMDNIKIKKEYDRDIIIYNEYQEACNARTEARSRLSEIEKEYGIKAGEIGRG